MAQKSGIQSLVRVVIQYDEKGREVGYQEVTTFNDVPSFAELQNKIAANKKIIELEKAEKAIADAGIANATKLTEEEKRYVAKYTFKRFLPAWLYCLTFGKVDERYYDAFVVLPDKVVELKAGLERAKLVESIVNSAKYEALGKYFNAMEE